MAKCTVPFNVPALAKYFDGFLSRVVCPVMLDRILSQLRLPKQLVQKGWTQNAERCG